MAVPFKFTGSMGWKTKDKENRTSIAYLPLLGYAWSLTLRLGEVQNRVDEITLARSPYFLAMGE